MANDQDEDAVGANSIYQGIGKSANWMDSETVANRSAHRWILFEQLCDSHELAQERISERIAGL